MSVKKKNTKRKELEAQVKSFTQSIREQSSMSRGSMFYHMEDTALKLARVLEQLQALDDDLCM